MGVLASVRFGLARSLCRAELGDDLEVGLGESGWSSGWSAQLMHARAEWRARLRWYLLLAVVGAVAVAGVVAAVTAAARSETAFERLRTAARSADISVFVSDLSQATAVAHKIDDVAGVDDAAAEAELFVRPAGTDLFPDFTLYARAPLKGGGGVNAPVISAGRAVDPRARDEVVLSEKLAADLGVEVGDSLTLESMTARWTEAAYNGGDPGAPDGPRVKVEVVGLSRSPADFGRWKGLLHLSPAFVDHYRDQMLVNARVDVRGLPGVSRRALTTELRDLDGVVEIGRPLYGNDAATDDGLGTIAISLLLVAAVAGLAGTVVVAFGVARIARMARDDRRRFTILGWTRRQLVGAAVIAFAPWLLFGVLAGLVIGLVASPLALVGLAHQVDPAPDSVVVDATAALAVALAALVIGLVAICLTTIRGAGRTADRARHHRRALPLQQPFPVILGVRRALGDDPERGGRANRGALVVAVLGIAGIVSALMISASIGRLQDDPALIGLGTGRVVNAGEQVDTFDRALAKLEQDRRATLVAGIHVAFGIATGHGRTTALAYDVRRGHIGASVVDGRIAETAGEVAMGPATLERLDKDVGDRVTLGKGSTSAHYRIVGSMLFPEGDFDHDSGIALTTAGADRLVGDVHDEASLHQVLFRWDDGVDARVADRGLDRVGFPVLANDDALMPASVTNLGEVEALPRVLAVFLGLMALATIGHAILSSLRRRSPEQATLRALGMKPAEGGAVVATHALTIAVVAVGLGLPLGLIVGARLWMLIATEAHVVVLSIVPANELAILTAAALLAVGALAVLPVRHAMRWRAPDVLRAE
jgi:putative ABC transport system permease protein